MFCSFAHMRNPFVVCRLSFVVGLLVIGRWSFAQPANFLKWKSDSLCVHWVDSVYNSLSDTERIGQFFMLPAFTEGKFYNMDSVVSWVRQGKAGGVIFFRGQAEAQVNWTNKIQDSAKVKCFAAIDGEWGLAMRIDSTIAFPKQMTLGAMDDNNLIYEMGKEIARECKRIGVNINFAPCVDVNNNPANPVINERSFGENKFKVAAKGIEYMRGLQEEGVLACAKHFPGHGDVAVDSHLDLPVINKSAAAFDSLEFFPFRKLFESGVGSAMVAHLNVPAFDSDSGATASLSRKVVSGLLKDSFAFGGLVFSDALNMKGVAKYYKPGTVDSIAFMAGCDILVFSEDAEQGIQKIKMAIDSGKISAAEFEARTKKILAYKYQLGLNKEQKFSTENLAADLNNTNAKLLRQKLFEKAITVAANQDSLLPLRNFSGMKIASLSIGNNGASQFQRHLNLFAEINFFNQQYEHNEKAFAPFIDTLATYDLVIVDLHAMSRQAQKDYNVTEETRKFLDSLSGRTKVVLVTFGNPYALKFFEYLPWLMCAYEESEASNLAAANALFGAEKISGKLPVTPCDSFPAGRGFVSDKIYRLKISSPEEVGILSEKLKPLDDVVQKGIDAKAFPGCQLLVAKDGKMIWNKCYGSKVYDSDDKVKPAQLYDLASITKVAATTIATMKLYDEKKIDLEKTVGDYLELSKNTTIKNLKLRDVITHQAGLKPYFVFWTETVGKNFDRYYRKSPDSVFNIQVGDSLFLRTDYPDTMWNIISHSEVDPHPKYVYSDCDFYILQKVVEKISEKKLDEYVNENFYQPMGLEHLAFNPLQKFPRERILPTESDSAFRKQIIRGYVHDPGAAMYGGVAGHAGLFSNAFDLAQIFQMLLNNGTYNGKRFLDSSTVKLFTARQSKISRRGFGFDKPEPDVSKPSPCYDGVPLSVFGHTGFTGTCVWSDPENNLTYIFLSNRVYPSAENNQLVKLNIRTDLQEVIYKAMGK